MNTRGTHIMADLYQCNLVMLDDIEALRTHLLSSVEQIGATVEHEVFHRFKSDGVSGVIVLSESHLSIHTWPTRGYASVDSYTCGGLDPLPGIRFLAQAIGAVSMRFVEIARGLPSDIALSAGKCERELFMTELGQFERLSR